MDTLYNIISVFCAVSRWPSANKPGTCCGGCLWPTYWRKIALLCL